MSSISQSKIIFTDASARFILSAFGKSVNDDGIIVVSNTNEPVLTPEGEEIHISSFGGIKKGSEIFITDDLHSAMNLVDGKY